jgi:FlaG/FlaF family flagellin (archaellin)
MVKKHYKSASRNQKIKSLPGESEMEDKKTVSALVATVLIVLITVGAITMIWMFVLPLVAQNLDVSKACLNAKVWIDEQSGYTCYDNNNRQVKISVERGADEVNLAGISVGVVGGGRTVSKEVREITQNLALYLKLNDGSGTSVSDSSGNINNGSITGSGVSWTNGKYSNALNFNGKDNNYVNSTMVLPPFYEDEITLEAWVLINESKQQQIYGKKDSFYLETLNGTEFNASFYIDGAWR